MSFLEEVSGVRTTSEVVLTPSVSSLSGLPKERYLSEDG